MLANFVLWREDGTRHCALLPGDLADAVRKRLSLYVLRSKVTLRDASADTVRIGVGGPGARRCSAPRSTSPPRTSASRARTGRRFSVCPDPAIASWHARTAPGRSATRLLAHAAAAPFAVWQWLTIRAGVPVVTTATQDLFVAQIRESRPAGRRRFQEGLLHRPGDHRADAIPRSPQGAAVRVPCPGRRRRGRRASVQQRLPGQPCGTVVNAAPAPDGGSRPHRGAAARGRGIRRRQARRRRRPNARTRCRCPMRCRRRPRTPGGAPTCAERHRPSMCLALVALDAHPRFRSSSPPIATSITRGPRRPRAGGTKAGSAGAISTAGGTWLGVTRAGRFAFVTNVREPGRKDVRRRRRAEPSSRKRSPHAAAACATVRARAGGGRRVQRLQPDRGRGAAPRAGGRIARTRAVALGAGVHGLSNAALDTAWPKVTRTPRRGPRVVRGGSDDAEALLAHPRRPDAGRRRRAAARPACRSNGSGSSPRRSSSATASATARAARRSCGSIGPAARASSSARSIPLGRATGTVDLRFALDGSTAGDRFSADSRRARCARPVAHAQAAAPAHRQRQLVAAMPERQPGEDRNAEPRPRLRDHRRLVVAVVVARELVAVERRRAARPSGAPARRRSAAGRASARSGTDARWSPRETGCRRRRAAGAACPTRCATSARLPPHSMPSPSKSGPSSAHDTSCRSASSSAKQCSTRERRDLRRAEIVGGHRPGERLHSGMRQCRQLEGREVAVADPALACRGERAIVERVEEARPAVSAAHGHREIDIGCGRHAQHRGAALVVGAGEALEARRASTESTTTRCPIDSRRATARSIDAGSMT